MKGAESILETRASKWRFMLTSVVQTCSIWCVDLLSS